jgi:hypothetical protein
MADNSETNARYVETIAILAVLVQIRNGTKGDPTEKDIESAQYAYDRVKGIA